MKWNIVAGAPACTSCKRALLFSDLYIRVREIVNNENNKRTSKFKDYGGERRFFIKMCPTLPRLSELTRIDPKYTRKFLPVQALIDSVYLQVVDFKSIDSYQLMTLCHHRWPVLQFLSSAKCKILQIKRSQLQQTLKIDLIRIITSHCLTFWQLKSLVKPQKCVITTQNE